MEIGGFSTSVFIIAMTVVCHVLGYPDGAPDDTCMTLFPKHGPQTQLEEGIFEVTASQTTYSPGQRITVTVKSPIGREFMGVIVSAHRTDVNQEELVGTFDNLVPSDKLKLLNCQGNTRNSVTHQNNQLVTQIQATWVAPSDNVGPIVFQATAVERFDKFHFGLYTPVLQPAPGSPAVTLPELIAESVNSTVAPIDWNECGETKGCLLYPSYCRDDEYCTAGVSFKVNDDDTATFELMAKSDGYVSLGFSEDRKMGRDQTISCSVLYDRVTIQNGVNPDYWNNRDLRTNLTKLEAAKTEDGRIYCRFTRPMSMDVFGVYKEDGTQGYMNFDLNNNEYYLFIAWGNTFLKSDMLGHHTDHPVTSNSMINISSTSTFRGSAMPKLVRAHSSLMAVAWMGFAGLAIMMARYYKNGFNDYEICGIKIWFHLHRSAAIMTFVLTVAGLISILVHLDGKLVKDKYESSYIHMCLGFTVVSLVCAQVVLGLVRPGPFGKLRPLFNFFHRLFGVAAIILATATLVYAYKMHWFSADMRQFGIRTIATWAAIFVFMELVFSGYQYFAPKVLVHRSRSDEYNLDKDDSDLELSEDGAPSNVLLVIFILFILLFITAALLMTQAF